MSNIKLKTFHIPLQEGADVRTDDFVKTQISWMHSQPNFFTHEASLRELR